LRNDIGRLMVEHDLDGLVVFGNDGFVACDSAFAYMTGGAGMTGMVVVQPGRSPRLLYRPMELHQAQATGLELVSFTGWDLREFLARYPDDSIKGEAAYYHQVQSDLGVAGRVAFYGVDDVSHSFALLSGLNAYEDIEVVASSGDDLLTLARLTKGADEVEAIRRTSRLTAEVVAETVAFLRGHRVDGDRVLRLADGPPLTVGAVKAMIGRALIERDLEAPDGFIFAIGADAGVPHSSGKPDDVLRLGVPIVFDIFPRLRGGYYTDMTRTFCLGHAEPEVEAAYGQLQDVYHQVTAALRVHELAASYQDLVCDLFESLGHVTIRQDRSATQGYIHSLGHGVGLQVHEEPVLRHVPGREDRILPGSVITVEPGLYYPERGFGMRIEDTILCTESGEFEILTPFSYDLVIPMDQA